MDFLFNYGLFFAKAITIVLAIVVIVAVIASSTQKDSSEKTKLKIKKLNKRWRKYASQMNEKILNKKAFKQFEKQQKKQEQAENKEEQRKRVFVIDFEGDLRASHTHVFSEAITAVLTVATSDDEVVVRVDSTGGVVHGYGLAASQLKRIRDQHIPLTVTIDKVAASGGYLMACVADRIIAAPFAIVGSIGVIAQLPNFHQLLRKHNIEYEQIMAGEYKRTISLFGENTKAGRAKAQDEVEQAHKLFKQFITEHRPQVDIETVATGEYWHSSQAVKLNLVDQLMTSDEYLMLAAQHADVFAISCVCKKALKEKLNTGINAVMKLFTPRSALEELV